MTTTNNEQPDENGLIFGELPAVREFQVWLNSKRMCDVSFVFHEIVTKYRAAITQQANVLPLTGSTDSQHDADDSVLLAVMGRALADRNADACGVNREDNWKIYSEDFIEDAKVALDAACRFRAQGGITNDKGSDLTPTTSTVSAPEEVRADPEQIECWSRDEEDFNARSLSDLLDTHDDLKPGDTVWVGEAVHPDPARLVNEDGIIENIGEAAYDIGGEHAEDYPDVTAEQAKELESLVTDWIKRTCPPTFYTVENIKPYVLSHEDFPHDPEPVQLADPDALRTTSDKGEAA